MGKLTVKYGREKTFPKRLDTRVSEIREIIEDKDRPDVKYKKIIEKN